MAGATASADPTFGWNLLDDLHQLLEYPFMVHAYLAGSVVAVVSGGNAVPTEAAAILSSR